ncbi:exonuclease [Croceivirga radicis]|uniref:Exonuclease n=1 Tax=Croceivirga radicis TaxID=1929488 RepID=A0A1V6LTP6_9FLAO|nr:exonuclease domain-containing protein [Croceivirga radicis]OQD43366.1 exonuclease [Croceivirga radicis]
MYAILDIESTGGKYNEEGIMEIAIHQFDGEKVTDTFISLLNPEREIQPFVAKLTGINNKMVKNAPKFYEVAKRILEITEDCVIVAHNAQFDYRILRTEFRRLGYDYQRKTLCTVDLSKELIPDAESHSLGKLVRSLGIAVSDRHRANGDALATLKLFKLLLAKDTEKKIVKSIIKAETLGELSPTQLDIVEALPSESGLYYMHDKDGDILFIGNSKNIKKRVNQHFTNVGDIARKLQKETKKVTFERTGGELDSLIKEAEEIRRNKPKYNRKQKPIGFSHGIYLIENEEGDILLKPQKANHKNARLSSFGSLKTAKTFLTRLKEKYGVNLEQNRDEQNNIVQELFMDYSTFNRDLIIIDRGRSLGEKAVFLIKKGTLVGMAYTDLNHQINNIAILETLLTPIKGTPYITFIIETLLRKKNRLNIIDLNQN